MYNATPLTAALGYPIRFPKAPITRSVRMLFKDKISIEPHMERPKMVPIKPKKVVSKDGLNDSQRVILKIVNKGKPVTGTTVAAETRWTQNHCSMVLTSLYKLGLIRRWQDKGNHTRWYVYMKKEGR